MWTQQTRRAVICLAVLTLFACASLPEKSNKEDSFALPPDPSSTLSQYRFEGDQPLDGESTFAVLGRGQSALIARMMLIKKAERSLDVQYYIFHNDDSGRLILDGLLEAADRGVRVRLLLDDLNTKELEREVTALNTHPSIDVRLFNPFPTRKHRYVDFLGDFDRLNNRMHNKSLTADNHATIVGGRNIGDEYFNVSDLINFKDLDLLGFGPIAQDVSSEFDHYWNASMTYDLEEIIPGSVPLDQIREELNITVAQLESEEKWQRVATDRFIGEIRERSLFVINADAQLMTDPPNKSFAGSDPEFPHLVDQLSPYLAQARTSIDVISAYFIPGDQAIEGFSSASARGVDIRIVTNSLAATDVPVVYSAYAKYRKPLLASGAELWELRSIGDDESAYSNSLHAKSMVIDQNLVFVGSINLDPRSVDINTEMGILVFDEQLAQLMRESINQSVSRDAYQLVLDDGQLRWIAPDGSVIRHSPDTSWWTRFKASFISLLPIEHQL